MCLGLAAERGGRQLGQESSGALAVSAVLERTLYARLYSAGELEQVLFTIGLIFMATAAAKFVWGPLPQRMTPAST